MWLTQFVVSELMEATSMVTVPCVFSDPPLGIAFVEEPWSLRERWTGTVMVVVYADGTATVGNFVKADAKGDILLLEPASWSPVQPIRCAVGWDELEREKEAGRLTRLNDPWWHRIPWSEVSLIVPVNSAGVAI